MKFLLVVSIFALNICFASESYLITVKNMSRFQEQTKGFMYKNLNLKNANVVQFFGNKSNLDDLRNKSDEIIRIEKDVDLKLLSDSSSLDNLFGKQWHLENTGLNSRTTIIVPGVKGEDIDIKKAWQITKGSSDIIVAVIDSGADLNHPDLKDNLWINTTEENGLPGIDDDNNGYVDDIYGYDFINDDNDPTDDNGHGSHCSGIIGAVHGNNGIMGVMGNVKIMALKFIPENGIGKMFAVLKAIDYAIEKGAKVMSNSWGGAPKESVLFDLLKVASEKGIIIINAAGNNSLDAERFPMYPASYDIPGNMSIGATMGRGSRARFSNYGVTSVDVFAPGQNIFSTWKNGTHKKKSGTSMAAPIVSGMAGLALSIDPNLTPEALRYLIIESSEELKELRNLSIGGRVNAHQLLEAVRN